MSTTPRCKGATPSRHPAPTSNMPGRIRRSAISTSSPATAGPASSPARSTSPALSASMAAGALSPHGEPVPLPSRPIHCCVDRSGHYLLTAFNFPSGITVHRIKADGAIGEQIAQREKLDVGIFAHQVLTTPGNKTAIMVTRGNHPEGDEARRSRRAEGLRLQRRRSHQHCLDPARQWSWLRTAPSRFPSDQAVGVRLGRAAEPALRLSAER